MRCWNCGKKIPDKAKACEFCKAAVEDEPTEEEEALVRDLLEQMPPEALKQLRSATEGSHTAEDFANRIFVGDCPKCGSSETGNCAADPETEELLVGRCCRCGQLWCTERGRLLERDLPSCPCWEEAE